MVLHLMDGESADGLLTRVVSECRTGNLEKISITEFDSTKSYDINGSTVDNHVVDLDKATVKKLLANDVRTIAFTLCKFEDILGAPLSVPPFTIRDVKKRSTEAIQARIDKYTRKKVYEGKQLSAISADVTESQNLDVTASLEALGKLIDAGEDVIYSSYLVLFNMCKRDELFYKRRHPKAVMLHRVLDTDLSAAMRECMWVMGVSNE